MLACRSISDAYGLLGTQLPHCWKDHAARLTETVWQTAVRTGSVLVSPCECLQDGRNWARIEADHHTHALFDVGAEGEWDSTFISHPQVVAAGPRDMRMFYHSFDAADGKFKVGMASSRDGFNWAKEGVKFQGGSSPQDFDAAGAAACQVVSV